ncbi:opacity protein-like surface antigen [Bradyrhizobium ottawaense]|uniref:outer membrane protein n=1 Tax=Bradyrhizobium ottawaense TaxID=931866 RepID=UPI0035991C41
MNKTLLRLPVGTVTHKMTQVTGKNRAARLPRTGGSWSGQGTPLDGYQMRYIYFLDPAARARLVPKEIAYAEIDRRGAGMYAELRVASRRWPGSPRHSGAAAATATLQRNRANFTGLLGPAVNYQLWRLLDRRTHVSRRPYTVKEVAFESRSRRMKELLLGAIALITLAAPASAADLAARSYVKAPPPVIQIYDWSRFYVGINGGGGSAHKCWDLVNASGVVVAPPLAMGCHNGTGGTVGGQIGYRWQIANSVFGLEAQGNWADFKGSNANLAFAGVRDESKLDALGLFTGQVGYAWNNVLVYVKGGAAVVRDKYRVFDSTSGLTIDNGSETRWGGTVGAGLEFGFAPNWSVGIEYDHLFMGHRDVDFFFFTRNRGCSGGRFCRDCPDQSGRRYRFGQRELPLG